MKNKNIIIFASLLVLPLVGCGGLKAPTEINPLIKNAVNSLRNFSHEVTINNSVSVLRPNDELAVDIYHEYHNVFGYYYNGEEKSYSRETSSLFADLDKDTHQPLENTIRTNNTSKELYFKNVENGTTYRESINLENEVEVVSMMNYDDQTGIYTPVIFDYEFKNPFDYISYRDIEINEDGKTLKLINEKADFLSNCYGIVGLNFIKDNTITLNDKGQIESISFEIPNLEEETFIRTNTLSITYQRGDDIKFAHVTPYANNNPELQQALDVLDDKRNFTYTKELTISSTNETDCIVGYFTEEEVFFHHQIDENDSHPYTGGDNYDYKAIRNADGQTYTGYEYIYSYGVNGFDWAVVSVSSSSAYVLNDFSEIGPSFMNLSANIFKKVDNYTYEIEEQFLPSIGIYFDYGFLGVQSLALDGSTNKLVIKLNENGNIDVIEAGFHFENEQYNINYYIDDVGTTSIPSWSYSQTIVD